MNDKIYKQLPDVVDWHDFFFDLKGELWQIIAKDDSTNSSSWIADRIIPHEADKRMYIGPEGLYPIVAHQLYRRSLYIPTIGSEKVHVSIDLKKRSMTYRTHDSADHYMTYRVFNLDGAFVVEKIPGWQISADPEVLERKYCYTRASLIDHMRSIGSLVHWR